MWCSNHHIICSGLLAAASSSISPVVRLSVCLSVCVCVYVCALRFVGHFSESKLRLFFCGTFFQKVNLEYFWKSQVQKYQKISEVRQNLTLKLFFENYQNTSKHLLFSSSNIFNFFFSFFFLPFLFFIRKKI